jgi:hypothetical protein
MLPLGPETGGGGGEGGGGVGEGEGDGDGEGEGEGEGVGDDGDDGDDGEDGEDGDDGDEGDDDAGLAVEKPHPASTNDKLMAKLKKMTNFVVLKRRLVKPWFSGFGGQSPYRPDVCGFIFSFPLDPAYYIAKGKVAQSTVGLARNPRSV